MHYLMYRAVFPRRDTRQSLRNIAADLWLKSGCNMEAAIKMAQNRDIYKSIIITILISVAIKLVVELIVQWAKDNVLVPPLTPSPGDPDY